MNRLKLKADVFLLLFLSGAVLFCTGSVSDGNIAAISTVWAAEDDKGDEYFQTEPEPEAESVSETEEIQESTDEDTLCIVIDPGHGGENLGGEFEDYTEKEMTLTVAKAMKEELEKYEGVTVYLTRTEDQDLTLEERCEYARSVSADFLFCLHFNLSEYHTLFGAECWVSAFGENYSQGYAFASVEMDMLQELGLYSRGIKTRLNSRGNDYYGIIRHAVEREIPCVLIEHCHLDQENDRPFYDHDEKLKAFGRLDATAAAKYFHLKSEELGADYSDYQNITVDVPSGVVEPDSTEPDICAIEVLKQNMETGEITVQVTAADYDSGMLYYTYSYDDGKTFSELQKWPDRTSDTFQFTIQVPPHIIPGIVVNGYNGFDLCTTSNTVSLPSMDYKTEEEIAAELAEKEAVESASAEVSQTLTENEPETAVSEENDGETARYLIVVCLVCALLVLFMAVSVALILCGRKRLPR